MPFELLKIGHTSNEVTRRKCFRHMTVVWRFQEGNKVNNRKNFSRCFRSEWHKLIGMNHFGEKFDLYCKRTSSL